MPIIIKGVCTSILMKIDLCHTPGIIFDHHLHKTYYTKNSMCLHMRVSLSLDLPAG